MLKVALIQLMVSPNKINNVRNACVKIKEAVKNGANLICLPECFNSPYGVKHFPNYSESVPNGDTCDSLSNIAKELKIWLIGGSIPEFRDGKLFNTSVIYNPDGEVIGKYSKIHLFDIDVPGKITFKESEVLSPGNKLVHFSIPISQNRAINVGIGICYDVRFPELAQIYARKYNCNLLLYPGAFNMTTGPLHWELLARARAMDNQCYVGLCSVARDTTGDYVSYGHTVAVGPWGNVLSSLQEQEDILQFEVNLEEVDKVRSSIPIGIQRREDIYSIAAEK